MHNRPRRLTLADVFSPPPRSEIPLVDDKDGMDIEHTRRVGDAIHVDLWYPRSPGSADRIVIGLEDVRAADEITVTYDFDRDGWVILMDRHAEDGDRIGEVVEENVEVAFIPAWLLGDDA